MKTKLQFIPTLLLLQISCGLQNKINDAAANSVKPDTGASVHNAEGNKRVKPKGIYVIRGNTGKLPDYVFTNPDVDGVFLKYHWDKLQPGETNFDWSDFDNDFDKALKYHKKIELSVVAGAYCPEWIYNKEVPKLHFIESQRNLFGNCEEYDVPLFWNEQYKSLWKNFIGSLAGHINSKSGYMEAITLVKLGGINSRSEEIKLPNQVNVDKDTCHTGDHRATWAHAGYKPSLLLNTWKEFADVTGENFPNSYIGLAMVIPVQAFPDVDDNSKVADKNNTHQDLLNAALKQFPGRLSVNFTALRGQKFGTPSFINEMHSKGAVTGYQLGNQFINPPCIESKTCDDNDLKDAIDNGFKNNADFIEVFFRTVLAYPGAIKYAKSEYKKKAKE